MAKGEKEQAASGFSEPESIALTAVHPWGPLARRAKTRLRTASLEVSLRNPGPDPLPLSAYELAPLRNAVDGGSAPADLSIEPSDRTIWPLPPGRIGTLRIGGQGRLLPGRYSSQLVLTAADGQPKLSVPVTLTVRAHWLWAFGSMVLGLAFLGLLLLLAGRATLNERLAETLAEQQELHEFLESAPATLTSLPLARQAREAVALAVESLTRPRPFGIEDLRLEHAERHLEEARTALATLQARTANETPGQLAVNALEAAWEELNKRFQAVQNLTPAEAAPLSRDNGFTPLLLAVQHAQWQHRFVPLALALRQSLAPQVERVRLALAAGEEERARKLAPLVTLWLRRAARQLDRENDLLLTWRVFAGEMLARVAFLEQARADPELPEAARRQLDRSLDTARRLLKPATLEGFRDASSELQQAETKLLRVRSDQLIEQIQATVTAADARTSLERIEAAIDSFSPDDSQQVRASRMLEALQRWRELTATVEDVELQQRILEQIAALETLLRAGDLKATLPGLQELFDTWLAYQQSQAEKAREAVIVPSCRRQVPAMQSQQLSSLEALALLQPHPDLDGLEAELDRVGAELNAGFSGAECLDRQVELSGQLLEISEKLFENFLLTAELSPEERLASAERSEAVEAVALARKLMLEPRPLRLEVRTPPAEIRVDRRITFEVGDLDPAWGPGTSLLIDFGDDTPELLHNAEELRQEPILQHRYTRPQWANVQVIAAQTRAEDILEWKGEIVGEGKLAITVKPSPISLARSLASFFLSVRFALALSIGLLIQGWRLYDEHPFGSRPRDYLEAFALGVGIQGLIDGLSTALTQLASGG